VTLREILGRLEWIIETLGDGDTGTAVDVLVDLRDELLAAIEERRAA
jgi:hypothetical protein